MTKLFAVVQAYLSLVRQFIRQISDKKTEVIMTSPMRKVLTRSRDSYRIEGKET